jgi:hypothetical protein
VNNRVLAVLALSVALLACCGGGIAYTFLRGRPPPSSGLVLVYACPEPVAASDAPLFQSRLDEVDAWASVEVVDPTHVRVRVGADESSRDLAAGVARTRSLELMPVDEAAMRALAASPLPPGVSTQGASAFVVTLSGSSPAALAPIEPLIPAGDRLVLSCDDPEPGCRGYVVLPSELGNADIARADASYDDLGGSASVGLTLTASGAERFESLTARIAGGRLAIVLDDQALSVPVVQEPIAGGRVMITMGGDSSLDEARAIAAALAGGRLHCSEWTLESESTFSE